MQDQGVRAVTLVNQTDDSVTQPKSEVVENKYAAGHESRPSPSHNIFRRLIGIDVNLNKADRLLLKLIGCVIWKYAL
jgi:hypothetical protein